MATKERLDAKSLVNYKALKKQLKTVQCGGMKYHYYKLDESLYVLGSTRKGAVVGRHFTLDLVDDSVDLSSMIASTKGCLVLQYSPSSAALIATHLLGDTPNEFHVMASIQSGKSIYVATANAIWDVSGTSIEFVQETNPDDKE